jgi:hypothetical protein
MAMDCQFICDEYELMQMDLINTFICPFQKLLLSLFHYCNIHNLFYLHASLSFKPYARYRSRSYFDKVVASRESEPRALLEAGSSCGKFRTDNLTIACLFFQFFESAKMRLPIWQPMSSITVIGRREMEAHY